MVITDDQILQRVAARSPFANNRNISTPVSVEWRISRVERNSTASLQRLDSLPLELLHQCVEYLDLASIRNFSQVSLRANSIVHSLRKLAILLKIASIAIDVLVQTETIKLHSLDSLYTALHITACVSCGCYGPYLHIFSGERCCQTCFELNQSLWMISLQTAKECFGLTNQQSKALPVMRTIPGLYHLYHPPRIHNKIVHLTSVRAAKELAIRINGPIDDTDINPPFNQFIMRYLKLALWMWYLKATLQPLSEEQHLSFVEALKPQDPYFGMGGVHFASVVNRRIELGWWCRTCQEVFQKFIHHKLEPDVLARLVPEGRRAKRYLEVMASRAWSEAAIIEHAKRTHLYDMLDDVNVGSS